MATITALTPDPRRPGRFAVVVDGQVAASVSIDVIERLSLGVGREYDALADTVRGEAAALKAYDRAVTMLASRGRSSAELRRLLIRKGELPEHVDAAVERLLAQRLLDDGRFAREFARSKALGAGHSQSRLRRELARKGVAREVADAAIRDVMESDEIDASAIIDDLARRKLRTLRSEEPAVQRRRLYGFLARRGYGPDSIHATMRRLLDGSGEEAAILSRRSAE